MAAMRAPISPKAAKLARPVAQQQRVEDIEAQ
jgi:hypothetical protein